MTPVLSAGVDVAKAGDYVRSRQTSDGGFFFARVPPATASDTYYALSALGLLGLEPKDRPAARGWIEEAASDDGVSNPRTLFHLCSAGALLGVPEESRRHWAERVRRFENPFGGFGAWECFDPEVTSELETTHYAVEALTGAGLDFDRQRVVEFVRRLQNADGGFGCGGCSTLPSTYLGVAVLVRLGIGRKAVHSVSGWLQCYEKRYQVSYIEELYWLVAALRILDRPLSNPPRAAAFVQACQLPSGGFSRTIFGIASLECTHYALQILRLLQGDT